MIGDWTLALLSIWGFGFSAGVLATLGAACLFRETEKERADETAR